MADTSSELSNLGNLFASYAFAKPEVKGLWYNRQTVMLDGYRFVGCRFDSCEIHINSNEFELDHCLISQDSLIVYGLGVVRPINLFVTRAPPFVRNTYPNFVAVQNSDGTITLK
jgi:hypothetical protein